MNRPENPCEISTSYSFRKCVRDHVVKVDKMTDYSYTLYKIDSVKDIGCAVSWDLQRSSTDQICDIPNIRC